MSFPKEFGEPALWKPDSKVGYNERIRLFIGGHTISSWAISIDQRTKGLTRGFYAKHDGKKVVVREEFTIKKSDFEELQHLIRQANLWSIYPQFFVVGDDDNSICIDGMSVILERRNEGGYRYSEGNAQCTLGDAQRAVAAKMMQMANHADLQGLLH